MGNKATPPRSFNTIRRSQTKVRAQRRRTQNVLLLAMFATVALILVALLVLGGFAIVGAIVDANPPAQSQTPTPPASTNEIQFIQTTTAAAEIHKGTLILVNSSNRYVFPEYDNNLISIFDNMSKPSQSSIIYSPIYSTLKMNSEAFAALDEMMIENYEVTGDVIRIADAYRTLEEQEGKDLLPGYSDHHTGYCIAIRYYDGTPIEQNHWIYQNAHKYGFVVRYPEGKGNITGVTNYTFCLRYVGVAHATYMYQNNLCLEEYLDLLKNSYSSAATRLTISAADGFDYDVYYVAASDSEVTTIDVPTSDFAYTVSGDNRGGFIVTVKKPVPAA